MLLDAADRLLSEGKFEATSLARIAEGAGISRPTFYFYFESKQALLIAVVERTLDDLTGRLLNVVQPHGEDPAAQIRATLRVVADLWWDHRGGLLAAAELAGSAPSVFDRIERVMASTQMDTATLLHEFGGSGLTRTLKSSERLASRIGWMIERNFYVLSRDNPKKRELEALADELTEIALAAARS